MNILLPDKDNPEMGIFIFIRDIQSICDNLNMELIDDLTKNRIIQDVQSLIEDFKFNAKIIWNDTKDISKDTKDISIDFNIIFNEKWDINFKYLNFKLRVNIPDCFAYCKQTIRKGGEESNE